MPVKACRPGRLSVALSLLVCLDSTIIIAFMLSYKLDFSFCGIKSSHTLILATCNHLAIHLYRQDVFDLETVPGLGG